MNSRDFFETEGHEWKGKSGVYCVEQPALSQFKGKRLFKVGYARNSIYTRMSDYRSAYGIVPFTIHCLIEIPAGVFGKRSGYTLLNEQRLHRQLEDDGFNAGANEWYVNYSQVMNMMYSLYVELVGTIDIAKNWNVFFGDKKFRFRILKIIDEKDMKKSKLYDDIIYGEGMKLRNKKY